MRIFLSLNMCEPALVCPFPLVVTLLFAVVHRGLTRETPDVQKDFLGGDTYGPLLR